MQKIIILLISYLLFASSLFSEEKRTFAGKISKKSKNYFFQTTVNQKKSMLKLKFNDPSLEKSVNGLKGEEDFFVSGVFDKKDPQLFLAFEIKKIDLPPPSFNNTKAAENLSKGVGMGFAKEVRIDTNIPF